MTKNRLRAINLPAMLAFLIGGGFILCGVIYLVLRYLQCCG